MQLESLNPATGRLVGQIEVTPVATLPDIVERARKAQHEWHQLGVERRAEILLQAKNVFAERLEDLSRLLTNEMGKPLRDARGEVLECGGDALERDIRSMVDALVPETMTDDGRKSVIYHDAFGVCAAITPWNFPIAMPHWMVLPALMAGNSVILKPSEETPLIAQAYADILNAYLPVGVLQTVHGADAQGKALVASDVDLIAFTGSREAGKHILASASGGLKRVILELGGKDPLLVLDDADVAKAARFAASNAFRNAGQVCVSTERIYVHKSVESSFCKQFVEEAQKLTVGPGLDDNTRIGPMINARQKQHVVDQIADAQSKGAKVILDSGTMDGNFLSPTVVTGVTADMNIYSEESFGPVVCVTPVSSDNEGISLANDTKFGLGAIVFGDAEHARTVARGLNAGMIGINSGVGGVHGTPWVGARESGYGFHGSRDGHRQFAQTRVISEPV